MRRLAVVCAVSALAFTACGGGEETEAGGAGPCDPLKTPIAENALTYLPEDFPKPAEVTFTNVRGTGGSPSNYVDGYFSADLESAFSEYKEALEEAGYEIVEEEEEELDAEIFWSGSGREGEIDFRAECEGRTELLIINRPAG